MPKIVGIERKTPLAGPPECPFLTSQGYKMADPQNGTDRHHAEHAIYKESLEDVAEGLQRGLSLWMKQPGKRETLISSASLRVRYV